MNKFQIISFTIDFILILKNLVVYAIIARIIISWFSTSQYGSKGKISQFLHDVTDPIINLARKIPHRIGMMDLSPLIAIICLDLISQLVVMLLAKLV